MIDALIFDLGGVIVGHDNEVMYRRIASRCPGGDGPKVVLRVLRGRAWDTGAPIAELHQALQAEAGYEAGWDQFVQDWTCHFTVDAEMLAYVEALAGRRRTFLFSNTNAEHWDHLVEVTGGRLGRLERYLSHEIGLAKPSTASFLEVARQAGIEPAHAVFFDDVAANVDGARAAGFQAELFVDQAGLAQTLARLGVA
ncbi:HAD-IA family hydrolase [Caulobacter sp. KR2-114]|uniref:HAD-IA family hydrolase n=1 Tax=Caulobacter sp. KR2-114 TaxID=3400912 RepID=UPI003BFF1122